MKATREILALEQILALCQEHDEALKDALYDFPGASWMPSSLSIRARRTGVCWTSSLIGIPACRTTWGRDWSPRYCAPWGKRSLPCPPSTASIVWSSLTGCPPADEWSELRRIRNGFTHDYPETARERHERLQLAITSASRLQEIRDIFADKIGQRFGL